MPAANYSKKYKLAQMRRQSAHVNAALTQKLPASVQALWHSSAHVLGQALEQLYGVDLTIGPTIDEGFYYDCFMGAGRGTLTHDEWATITARMEAAAKEAQPFQRVEISQQEALDMFQENTFKARRTAPARAPHRLFL